MKKELTQRIEEFDEMDISNDELSNIDAELNKSKSEETEEDIEVKGILKEMAKEYEDKSKSNPRNIYLRWAKNTYESANFEKVSPYSKLRQFIARILFGKADKQLLAPWAWWTNEDKVQALTSVFDKSNSENEMVKRNKYYTTRQIYNQRNQVCSSIEKIGNFFAIGAGLTVFTLAEFFSMSGLNQLVSLGLLAGFGAYKFRKTISDKFGTTKTNWIHRVLITSSLFVFVGNFIYGSYQRYEEKVEAAKVQANKAKTALDESVKNFGVSNDIWLNNAKTNKQQAVYGLDNLIYNTLQSALNDMTINKKNVSTEVFNADVKQIQDILVNKDLPVINEMLNENLITKDHVQQIQSAVETKMNNL